MPRDHVVDVGTRQSVEDEVDGFAMEHILAICDGEFSRWGAVLVTLIEYLPSNRADQMWRSSSFGISNPFFCNEKLVNCVCCGCSVFARTA
jgi:hypothetical protein